MYPTCSYLVCATPRSGSTLLCEALANTGIAGNPKEYFEALRTTGQPRRPKEYFSTIDHPEIAELLGDFSRLDDLSTTLALQGTNIFEHYLTQVLAKGTSSNGVFGAKVMWGYFDDFISNLRDIPSCKELPTPILLATVFPNLRYIWVTREDKLRQAISLWKAIQTWTWREDESSTPIGQPKHPKKELYFHFEAIDHLRQQIVENEQAWQRYFDASAIEPLKVSYEDLSENYEITATQILKHLHIPMPECIVFAERRMKRQADALSEEWAACYNRLKQ